MTRAMRRNRGDNGFTLIELLLSMSIIGVVLGAVSSALIVFLKNSDYTLARDDHSGGALVLSSYLDRDLSSADAVTTGSATCTGASIPVGSLVLAWSQASANAATPAPNPSGGGSYVSAYFLSVDASSVPVGPAPATRYKLERVYCVNGALLDRQVLVLNLAAADFLKTGTNSCASAATPVTLTLRKYASDNASDYRYSGCLKSRLR